MKRLITAKQALSLDIKTQAALSVSAETLMERAGKSIFENMKIDFPNLKSVVVLVGPGHNGGDGLVVARYFAQTDVKIVIVCPVSGSSPLWLKKQSELLFIFENRAKTSTWVSCDDLAQFIDKPDRGKFDLFIDAGFGVGLTRPLSPMWTKCLWFLSERSKSSASIDILSGLNGTTGVAESELPRVNKTYAIGFAKLGHIIGDGPRLSGQIKILDIGFYNKALKDLGSQIYYFQKQDAVRTLPKPSSWEHHKAKRGHLLVIGGAPTMEGAGFLAAMAGARMGAGYVTWMRIKPSATRNFPDSPVLLHQSLEKHLENNFQNMNPSAIVVGPGLGRDARAKKLVCKILDRYRDVKLVVDADALYALKKIGGFPVPSNWILTPHEGELASLLNVSASWVHTHRLESLELARNRLGGVVLLKGFKSMISIGSEKILVNSTGGPTLAKAGTGDVLAGMIGGLLALGYGPQSATILATYLHGKTGDLYKKKWINDFSLIPTDIFDLIPQALKELYADKQNYSQTN